MTTYYISPSGSDSNTGLSPDASALVNKPWLTLGKAVNTGSVVLPGDIVYIAPGYYYSAACTPITSIASVGSPTQFIGDPTNYLGFKDGSGVLLAPGQPWITQRASGDTLDGPIASATNLLTLTTNDPKGLYFSNVVLEAQHAGGYIANADLNGSTDIHFDECVLVGMGVFTCPASTAATAGRNWFVRRCEVFCAQLIAVASTTAAATADADLNIRLEESLLYGKLWANNLAFSSSGGNLAGGLYVYGNTIITSSTVTTAASKISTTTPIKVGANLFICAGSVLTAGTSGQIIDDGYNRFINVSGVAPYSSVTQAGTSIIGIAPNLVLPHLEKWGLSLPRSDFLGWTDAAHANQKFSASGRTTPDFRGRTVRPWGAGASIGCFQVPDLSQDATSAISTGGVNSAKLTGAGEFSCYVRVTAGATTISVVTKSGSYGGTNYPQLVVVANGAIGLTSDQTATASDATEQTITSPSFTPTVAGVVEVRLISRSSSPTSTTNFDVLTVSP